MSSIGSPSPFLIAGKKSLTVSRSLRFNDGDSTHLSRTPSNAGNRKTFTWSGWIKRGEISSTQGRLFGGGVTSTDYFEVYISGDDLLRVIWYASGQVFTNTTAKFRDPSAWYHIVIAVDTTQSTAANRIKIYVNGILQAKNNSNAPSQNSDTSVNNTVEHNIGKYLTGGGSHYFDGYITEINFIDGQQLTPSSFAETDATTGQWIPKQYTGSYGTNGFYLKFADNSGTTATTLGKDSSGNGNNWTPNNFSVTAGEGNDSSEDTPTNNFPTLNALDMGSTNSSHLVFSNGNLQVKAASGVWASTRGSFHVATGKWYWEVKIVSAASLRPFIGIIESDVRLASNQTEQSNELGPTSTGIAYWVGSPLIRGGTNTTGTSTNVPSCTVGDIVGVALDMDNKKVFFSKNGTFFASQDPANSSGELVSFSTTMQNATIAPAIQVYNNTSEVAMNFGQRPFDYTPPTGYKKLNSQNLPSPTILKPNKHFDTLLWSGNSSTQAITGLNFSPDWVWSKRRSASSSHYLSDTIRGVHKILFSELTGAEYDGTSNNDGVDSFDSNGFTFNNGTYVADYNASGSTYVGWNWDAGETDSKTYTVTVVNDGGNKYRFDGYGTSAVTLSLAKGGTYTFNYPSAHPLRFSTTSDGTHGGGSEYTSGVSTYGSSITITVASNAPTLYYYCSQHSGMGGQVNTTTTLGSSNFGGAVQSIVKANTTSGFSIVTYTGNATNGATIGHGLGVTPTHVIWKNRSSTENWINWQTQLGDNCLLLNLNNAKISASGNSLFTFGDFNSTTLKLGAAVQTNGNGNSMVAYCFSEVAGYSKFGSYTGNGSSDGPFVFTGFRPALFIQKRTDTSGNWYIFDNKRSGYNVDNDMLVPNVSDAEYDGETYPRLDFVSNGIKWRDSGSSVHNASGGTYIYLAFAESPFKYARAR